MSTPEPGGDTLPHDAIILLAGAVDRQDWRHGGVSIEMSNEFSVNMRKAPDTHSRFQKCSG